MKKQNYTVSICSFQRGKKKEILRWVFENLTFEEFEKIKFALDKLQDETKR